MCVALSSCVAASAGDSGVSFTSLGVFAPMHVCVLSTRWKKHCWTQWKVWPLRKSQITYTCSQNNEIRTDIKRTHTSHAPWRNAEPHTHNQWNGGKAIIENTFHQLIQHLFILQRIIIIATISSNELTCNTYTDTVHAWFAFRIDGQICWPNAHHSQRQRRPPKHRSHNYTTNACRYTNITSHYSVIFLRQLFDFSSPCQATFFFFSVALDTTDQVLRFASSQRVVPYVLPHIRIWCGWYGVGPLMC